MRKMPFIETQTVPEWRGRLFPAPQGATPSRISAALREKAVLEGLREDLLDSSLEDFSRGGSRRGAGMRNSDKALLRSPILMRMILEGRLQFGICPIVTLGRIEAGESLFPDLLASADPLGEIDAEARLELRRHYEEMARGRWGRFLPVIAGLHRMEIEGGMELSEIGAAPCPCMRWGETVIIEGELSLAEAIQALAGFGADTRGLMFLKPLESLQSIDARRMETIDHRKSLLDTALVGMRFEDDRAIDNARTIAAAVARS